MVYFFTSSDDRYVLFMGRDKEENDTLIRYGHPEDVWFHVDRLSSAHVYVRLPEGETIGDIPPAVLEEATQLTKLNSIDGSKQNNVSVVYTPWSNLHKTGEMDVGQVGFKKRDAVRKVVVEKRVNEVCNRLNKTKVERHNDPAELAALREARDKREQAQKRHDEQRRRVEERDERSRRQAERDVREYKGVFDEEKMETNADKLAKLDLEGKTEAEACRELEEDFM